MLSVSKTNFQVQHLVMDDIPSKLTSLFEEQKEKGGAGGRWATRHQRTTLEQGYQRQAEAVLVDDNPFKFIFVSPFLCHLCLFAYTSLYFTTGLWLGS